MQTLAKTKPLQSTLAGTLLLLGSMVSSAALAIDGAYDPAFASGGRRTVLVSGFHNLRGVQLRPDRRVLLAGDCAGFATNGSMVNTLCAAELAPNGALTSFGPPPGDTNSGMVAMTELQPQLPGDAYFATDSALDVNGRLLITAQRSFGAFSRAVLALFSTDGDVLEGLFERAPSANELDESRFDAVVVDALNRMVLAGSARRTNGRHSLVLMRLDQNLDPDASFGTNGTVRIDYVDRNSFARDVEIDSQGRILVVCDQYESNPFSTFSTVFRFTSSGDLDASFGTGGESTVANTIEALAGGLAIDASDRPVVLGITQDPFEGDDDLFVARFLTDGNPDFSFYPILGVGGGFRRIEAEDELTLGANEVAGDVLIQPNGKILLTATASRISGTGVTYFFSMRLRSDGANDVTYGAGGATVGTYSEAPSQGYQDSGIAQALDPAGMLYIAGSTRVADAFSIPTFGVARLQNGDGVGDDIFANSFE